MIKKLITLVVAFIIASCNQQKDFVTETDLSTMKPDTINGETIEQAHKKAERFYKLLLSNTIDKRIPDIEVFTIDEQILNLRDLIQSQTIILASDAYCGWGTEFLRKDFPSALQEIGDVDARIVCLIKREAYDVDNPKEFQKRVEEFKQIYETLYIIDERESRKINLFANPARLYVNNDKDVKAIGMGASVVEGELVKEIKDNLALINE